MAARPRPPAGKSRPSHRAGRQSLRIIAGLWRGRRITFPELAGLRPTGDRIRETLFNWLQPWIAGEDCLDLFAGSGACGFEALSRGARRVVFVEAAREAAQAIEQNLSALSTTPDYRGQADIVQKRAEQWLAAAAPSGSQFGVVFVDPPFVEGEQTLLLTCCHLLEAGGLLKPHARIYLESGAPFVSAYASDNESADGDENPSEQTSGAQNEGAAGSLPANGPVGHSASNPATDRGSAPPSTLPPNWRVLRQQRAGAVYYGLFERLPVDSAG